MFKAIKAQWYGRRIEKAAFLAQSYWELASESISDLDLSEQELARLANFQLGLLYGACSRYGLSHSDNLYQSVGSLLMLSDVCLPGMEDEDEIVKTSIHKAHTRLSQLADIASTASEAEGAHWRSAGRTMIQGQVPGDTLRDIMLQWRDKE